MMSVVSASLNVVLTHGGKEGLEGQFVTELLGIFVRRRIEVLLVIRKA
jgi:hypothetical protein